MNLSRKHPSHPFSNAFSFWEDEEAALLAFFRASSHQKKRWNATWCTQKLLQLHGVVGPFESSKELAERRASKWGSASRSAARLLVNPSVKKLKQIIIDCKACVIQDTKLEKSKTACHSTRRIRSPAWFSIIWMRAGHLPFNAPFLKNHSVMMLIESTGWDSLSVQKTLII